MFENGIEYIVGSTPVYGCSHDVLAAMWSILPFLINDCHCHQ